MMRRIDRDTLSRMLVMVECAVACAVAVMLAGCAPSVPTEMVADWQLEAQGVRASIHLPAHVEHGLDRQDAVYRLRTVAAIPAAWRGEYVTLGIPILRANVRLFVDGKEVPSIDDHALETIRTVQPHRFRIDRSLTTGPTIALELVVASDWVQATWIDCVPRLSLGAFGDRWCRNTRTYNVTTAIITVIAMATLALIFAMRRVRIVRRNGPSDDKNGVFAILLIGSTIQPATQIGLFQPLLGRRDLGMLLISFIVTTTMTLELCRRYLEQPPRPRWHTPLLVAICAVDLLGSGLYVGTLASQLLIVAFALFLGNFGIMLVRYRTAPQIAELRWMAISWVAVAVFAGIDAVTIFGYGAPLQGIEPMYLATLLFGSIVGIRIGRDHRTLTAAQADLNDELSARLADIERRNVEIGALNVELQRKVGDRSRELAAALRRLHDDRRASLENGSMLADRYRVERFIGAGAMGEVYAVVRIADGQALAAKVIRGRARPAALERFTREAELTARIEHPNVVRVLDVDVTGDGELFLAMELVDGRSLDEDRSRWGETAWATRILGQVASALAAIHLDGVVHRDLKPANILVGAGDVAKVADFGIAGFGERSTQTSRVDASGEDATVDALAVESTIDVPAIGASPALTAAGALLGTPMYMAPELFTTRRAMGTLASPSTDVFAFGLIAYQLLGGGTVERVGVELPPLEPFSRLAPSLSADLHDALTRCLARDATRRPSAERLAQLLSREG